MKNDTIINIGLQCSEDDIACFNSYFTIYSVSTYPFQSNLNRKKILISPSKVKFSDAILSLDEKNIYFLVNYGKFPNELFCLSSLDLTNLASISSLNAYAIPDVIFPLRCDKIHEYNPLEFVLHCKSVEYSLGYIPNSSNAKEKEIVYFIELINEIFISKFYFNFYEEKYLKIRSTVIDNEGIINSISSTKFFTTLFQDLSNNYSLLNLGSSVLPVIINWVGFLGTNYLYARCRLNTLATYFTSIIYLFDSSNQQILQAMSISTSTTENCVKSQIPINDLNVLLGISTRIDQSTYLITLKLLDTQLNILNSQDVCKSAYDEIPLSMNNENNILVTSSEYDNSKIKRSIKIHELSAELSQILELSFSNQNDVVASTFLQNLDNGFSFGGSSFSANFEKDNSKI